MKYRHERTKHKNRSFEEKLFCLVQVTDNPESMKAGHEATLSQQSPLPHPLSIANKMKCKIAFLSASARSLSSLHNWYLQNSFSFQSWCRHMQHNQIKGGKFGHLTNLLTPYDGKNCFGSFICLANLRTIKCEA